MTTHHTTARPVRTLAVSAAMAVALLGVGGCGADDADAPASTSRSTSKDSSASGDKTTPPASSVDRTTLPWNDDVPADFPLEEVPLPTEGTFDYAEKVDDNVWNVMISDIPTAVHEAWISTMSTQFTRMNEKDLRFLGDGASGASYSVWGTVFDTSADGVTMAYRIAVS